ncbi:MAG: hypothetical protein IPG31_00475 [Nitrosomonas sp.]|nr:hypothetical protein [Nitrosomonas sp.]
MDTRQEKFERKAKILLFVVITVIVMATKEITKVTVINNLVYSVFLWALLWLLYVVVRDTAIIIGWKKPAFPLPQYEQEDMGIAKAYEEDGGLSLDLSNSMNPHNRLYFPRDE